MTTQVSRRSFGKAALVGMGALTATTVCSTSANAAASDIITVSAAKRAADIKTLLGLINAYRAQNGLGALKHSATVQKVMEAEARRQFVEGYFSHSTAFLYNTSVQGYSFAREIISLSYQGNLNDLMSFWKSSPSHNAALLAPEANVCGIGFAYGSGAILPWKVLGNVAIYRYEAGKGPNDYTNLVSNVQAEASNVQVVQPTTYQILPGIAARYNADGGANFYGNPTAAEGKAANGGAYQNFNKNGVRRSIYWHASTGAYAIYEPGTIANFWRQNGAERGFGYPTMNERSGLVGGGAYQTFRNGKVTHKVMWHPTYGVGVIYENGAIAAEWRRLGSEAGAGYPISREYLSGVEMRQRFSNGITIAWDSFTGKVRSFKG